jgi:hypothetical protein
MDAKKLAALTEQLDNLACATRIEKSAARREPIEEHVLRTARSAFSIYCATSHYPLSESGAVLAMSKVFSHMCNSRIYSLMDFTLLRDSSSPKWILSTEFKHTIYKVYLNISAALMTGKPEDL